MMTIDSLVTEAERAQTAYETHETRRGTCPDCGHEREDCCALCGCCTGCGPCGCTGHSAGDDDA